MWFAVNIHKAIRALIPSLVDLLKDIHLNVRLAAISGLVKLAEHGEFD
jgi:HEAT repeat protein